LSGLLLQETLRRHWYTHRDIRKALNNDLAGYSLQVAALFLINSFMPLQVSTALLAMGAGAFAAFGLGMTSVVKVGPKDVVKVETLVAQHWPLTSWLVVTVLAVWGAGQLYPFLITPLGVAAVAAFMACRNILNVMGLLVQSIGNFLPSHVARLRRRDGEVAVCRHLLLTCLASAVACGFFLLVLLIGGGPLLSLLYGGMYDEASTLLNVLALATVCSVFGALFGAYALGLEDSRSGFFSNLGATAVTFTVGLYLIWRWGIDGAAWGAVASSATASVLQAWFVLARLRVGTVRPE
jgi:O-antigen/teichoic acid export membrane protein